MRLAGLVENETLKILRRKRFRVVLLVLGILLAVVVFGQARQRRNAERDNPTGNWRARVESRIAHMERDLGRRNIPRMLGAVDEVRDRTPPVPPREGDQSRRADCAGLLPDLRRASDRSS